MIYKFYDVTVEVQDDAMRLRTCFYDGTSVPASPEDTYEYLEKTYALGYGRNTWRMCFDHELLHTYLAWLKGEPSLTLWAVAHGHKGLLHPLMVAEEEAVLRFQRQRSMIPDWERWRVE